MGLKVKFESVRQHIASKGHCRIPYETKEEKLAISQFYDFSVEDEPKRKPKKARKHVEFSDEAPSTIVVEYETNLAIMKGELEIME